MQFKKVAAAATAFAAASAEDWDWQTLTPKDTMPCGHTVFTSTFGIAVQPIDAQMESSLLNVQNHPTETSCTLAADATPTANADACQYDGTLQLHLVDGILYDSHGRVGSIVANNQFQFDGPPPQHNAIYAKGWSITEDGYLAIGNQEVFYQCLSGDFYNLYDKSIAAQCSPIRLEIVSLIKC